jgi:LysR family transcriptional regulator, mexEF-oprN operon transcriptional activator
MNADYGRNLDLNLLRVFVVVAETGSVTAAAAKLYLTQPAISAALRRLNESVGVPLFARQGRGVTLTSRGERLLAQAGPHLASLVDAALAPADFDPKTSDRTLRIGLSDVTEASLLPGLLRILAKEAPRMRVVVLPVQFRTVGELLASRRIDVAVSVADELPTSVRRRSLYHGTFVCLFDPRHTRVGKRISEAEYFAREHVIVSYNGDLRGIVEDLLKKTRTVRCSLPSFSNLGAVIDGTALIATVPQEVARYVQRAYPHLATADKPFTLEGTPMELLWPAATEDDPALRFVREAIVRVSSQTSSPSAGAPPSPRAARAAKLPTRSARTRSSRRSTSRDRRREA